MKITYDKTTIDFFDYKKIPQQVLLSLSGGLDSACLFYLLCRHLPSIEIIPFTAADVNFSADTAAAKNVTDWMKMEFPKAKIKNLQSFVIDQEDRTLVTEKEIKKFKKGKKEWKDLSTSGLSKIIQKNKICQNIHYQYPDAILCEGMTKNPPIKVMKAHGLYDLAEKRRDNVQITRTKPGKKRYQPFVNVNKRFIAEVYKKNNLMNTLFPLTKSCVGDATITDNFTKECRSCFWCYEKKWAFDLEW